MSVGTPGRLRIAAVVAVGACLLFGSSAAGSIASRSSSIADARNHAAQLVRIQAIRSNLTQADAAATNAFLVGGLEPADQRTSYSNGIAGASAAIAAASAGSTADARVLAKTNQILAQYSGLIESARANNRQGFPIGAAYLRQASNLLRSEALPPLAQLVSVEQARIKSAYDNAAQDNDAVVPTLILAFVMLAIIQIWLSVKTRRTVNMSLAIATVLVVVGGLVGVAAMSYAQHKANGVRAGSLANTVALSTARTDAFDGKSAESLTLINRGSGQPFEAAYQVVIKDANAALTAVATRPQATASVALLDSYESAHRLVRKNDDAGDWDAAVALATSNDLHGTKVAFAAFDATSGMALTGQAAQVSDGLSSARRPLDVIAVLMLFAGIAAAVLAWRGIAARLREYR
jgi:flagellar basal body-associated protein FliL